MCERYGKDIVRHVLMQEGCIGQLTIASRDRIQMNTPSARASAQPILPLLHAAMDVESNKS